jgi:tetratricopeptide (TPR) repeat protein
MRTIFLLLAAGCLALFFFLAAQRPEPADQAAVSAGADKDARREAVTRFWSAYREATALRLEGKLEEAVPVYQQALSYDPEHQDALYYLSNVFIELRRWDEAEATLERLIEVNPRSARAHSRLGDLKLCFGPGRSPETDEAVAAFDRALQINREETGPMHRLGETELLRGDWARAIGHFEDASRSNFTSIEAFFFASYAAWKLGDRSRAGEYYERAIQLATPEDTAPAVVGEGDTKKGSRPDTSPDATCPLIREPLDAFIAHVAASTTPRMEQQFALLDEVFAR